MTEFEYTNGLFDKEVNLIIDFISQELTWIKKNKNNLVNFAYSQSVSGKLIYIDFQRIMKETQRMSVEIEFLEEKRRYYIKIKEQQQQQQQQQHQQL
jgi:hypothetical protein